MATRQAYGLTEDVVSYRSYTADASTTPQQVAADAATISNIRLLDPTIVSPAFTQFQQGKNFYYFPDHLNIDRYRDGSGELRDYVVAARELNPDRLIDNQRNWINRHTVYTHGNGFIASPANTVRGIANDPNQNGGYPEFLVNAVGAEGVINNGPAQLSQPRIYFGPVIANTSADYAIVGENGSPREYDFETSTETRNYTYTGSGGVSVGNWLARGVFAAEVRRTQFPVLQRHRAGQQDPVQPGSGGTGAGGRALADHRQQGVSRDSQQADRVDRRRLHHPRQLPVLPTHFADLGNGRLQRDRGEPAGPGQAGVIHPQLGEGDCRCLRRNRHAVRARRKRPGAEGVDQDLPGNGQAEERDFR